MAPLNLRQTLDEMDIALADEIEKLGSKLVKHIAVNGKSLGEQNGLYLYDFSLKSPWTPQDDTPVSVCNSTSSVAGTIVKSAGMSILVSFEKPLTSEELQKLDIYSDSTELTKRLREALKNAKDSEQQLASKCFGLIEFQKGKRESKNKLSLFGLDESQASAAHIALGSEITYIIGPPGTGKTYTIAALAYTYMSEGRSILIAAHTNIAVDNAIKSLVESCSKKNLVLHEGQAVRFGATNALKNPTYEKAYIPAIIERRTSALGKRKEEITARLKQISEEKVALQKKKEQELHNWETQHPQYMARRDFCKSTMAPLQIREQQRIAAMNAQMQQAESKLRNTQREVENAKQALAQIVHQQVQLKWLVRLHISNANTLENALVNAQKMNRIKRFLKSINIEKISDEVAQAKHIIWQDEQQSYTLQSRIQALHTEQSRVEKLASQYYQEYNAIRYQSTLSSPDKQQIAQLQTELAQLEARIAQGDELQKQQSKQRGAQDRLYKNEVEKLEEEQTSIDRQLQDIEKKIIAEAQVVATTLSKVYMNIALAERQFDVVIMDEVSMAPLPATYVVACHANKAVIALGDPQQLPPIVQAKTESAEKWLSKSLFDHNSITLDNAASSRYGNSAVLQYQSRMHPDIAIIASKYVYNNKLYNSPRVVEGQALYSGIAPLQGKRLLLCDTSDASPITTKPEEGSRINIYHALCVIAVAKQILNTLPPPKDSQSDTIRIGIVTPYKKQAELLQHLVVDAVLEEHINTGTVHRFQGLEYDVIIFDTVDSGFLKPVQNFTKGTYGSNAMRLINVATTRARHKLIVIANSAYVRTKFDESDTLRLAVEMVATNTIKSNDVFEIPFSKISEALQKSEGSTKEAILGRYVEEVSRQKASIQLDTRHMFFKELRKLNEQSFFEAFKQDVQTAKKEVLIVSPFLAVHRTNFLLPLMQTKCMAGIKIHVVTKPVDEYNIEGNAEAEQLLKNANIDVLHKRGVHEKIAIIDKQIIYSGSLNILSHKDTSEFMVRLSSQKFAEEVESFMGLSDSPKSYKKPEVNVEQRDSDITISCNELPKLKCACGHDMHARVGKYGPFYGCVNYSKCTQKDKNKDIAEEHLQSVSRLANISCTKCSSSTPMKVRVNRRDAWLECSNTASCDYKKNIFITKN